MIISSEDRAKIKQYAKFLRNRNFETLEDADTIVFTNGIIDIIADYERYDNISSLVINFKREKEMFNVGWIAFVRKNLQSNPREPLQNILHLLDFFNANFDQITNYTYCKESQKLIENFIVQHKK